MRKAFPEFYKLSSHDLERMSKKAVIAFDASYLLDLYRFSDATAQMMFSIMAALSEQIWLPHQCAFEFHKNRLRVLGALRSKHADLLKRVEKDGDSLIKMIEEGCSKHPLLDGSKISAPIRGALSKVLLGIRAVSDKHPKASQILEDDPIWKKLDQIFRDAVGLPYTEQELRKHEDEGKQRFAKRIPPGFADEKKEKPYGDYLIWRQLLDHCRLQKRPAIFVTSDVKEDWWLEDRGQKHGVLPELRREFIAVTGQEFHLYETTHFLEVYGPKFNQASERSVEEIRKLRDEAIQRARAHQLIAQQSLASNQKLSSEVERLWRVRPDLDAMRDYERAMLASATQGERLFELDDLTRRRFKDIDIHARSEASRALHGELLPGSSAELVEAQRRLANELEEQARQFRKKRT